MFTASMLIALSLSPADNSINIPVPPTAPKTAVERIVLDNFDYKKESAPLLSSQKGLDGVLNGVRYVSVSVDGCDKEPSYCPDVTINNRKSGVLSVAYTKLAPETVGEVIISYQVDIDDLREYTFWIGDLNLSDEAREQLEILVVVNGVEYPIDTTSLTYDFFGANGGDAVNVKSFQVKFRSLEANSFEVDNLELSRRKAFLPKEAPSLGSNLVPFAPIAGLGIVAALLDNGSSESQPVVTEEIITELPPVTELPPLILPPITTDPEVIPPMELPIYDSPEKPKPPVEPVPEPTTILGTILTGIIGFIAKRKQG